jgi:hypothetical protein
MIQRMSGHPVDNLVGGGEGFCEFVVVLKFIIFAVVVFFMFLSLLFNLNVILTTGIKVHEGKTELVQIDLRRRLQEMRCEEGGDIKAHFGEQLCLRESLAGMQNFESTWVDSTIDYA